MWVGTYYFVNFLLFVTKSTSNLVSSELKVILIWCTLSSTFLYFFYYFVQITIASNFVLMLRYYCQFSLHKSSSAHLTSSRVTQIQFTNLSLILNVSYFTLFYGVLYFSLNSLKIYCFFSFEICYYQVSPFLDYKSANCYS